MSSHRFIASTTHEDSHGDKLTIGALKSGAKQINSYRKLRMGVGHDWTFPPMGRVVDATVEKRQDGEHQLVATMQEYDRQELVRLPDGSPGILESFTKNSSPFVESEDDKIETTKLSIDIHNFSSFKEADKYLQEAQEDVSINIEKGYIGRKALINDPEVILALSKTAAYSLLGGLAIKASEKAIEKLTDKSVDVLIELLKLIKNSSIKGIKQMLPKNRKITYIIRSSGTIAIEIIIRTSNANTIVEAVTGDRLEQCKQKIKEMSSVFNLEKLNLLYNEEKSLWEFNYLLTKDGASLSSPRAYTARNKAYKDMSNHIASTGNIDDPLNLQSLNSSE